MRVFAWAALLVSSLFLLYVADQISESNPRDSFAVYALVLFAIAGLVTAGYLFIRWLCCWRNLRRFLFCVAVLVTLVALFYAEENWRGKHAWQKFRNDAETRGEKFTLEALAPPAVPDDRNFALTPLLKPALDFTRGPAGVVWHDTNGLARLDKLSTRQQSGTNELVLGDLQENTFANLAACAAFYRGNTNYPQAQSTAGPAEVILTALGKFDSELKELQEAAAKRPDCRFPIQYTYEPSWQILLHHVPRMRGLTMLSGVRAIAELDSGRAAEAFADLKLGLRLSDSLRGEPLLIDHLVRIATLGIDLQTIREGLLRRAWTDSQLAELQNYLASVDLLAEYKLAMRGERALSTQGLDYLRRRGFKSDPLMYMSSEEDGTGTSASMPFNPMPGGWFYQNMLAIARLHQDYTLATVDEKAHRVFPEISAKGGSAIEEMGWGPYTIIAKMLFPAMGRAIQRSARMQTAVDAACLACALERYRIANGKLPETLDALTPAFIAKIPNDVVDGKPLRYQLKSDDGYVLYSLGWNQKDDGGEIVLKTRPGKAHNVEITKGDWVWEMPPSKS